MNSTYVCPVCGYGGLQDPPRTPSGGGSYEICPSCGFEFGVTDDDLGLSYDSWRRGWLEQGYRWAAEGLMPPPPDWDGKAQLDRYLKLTRDD